MSLPDHHSPFWLSSPPPQHSFAADTDAISIWPQFPIPNEHFDPHSQLVEPPPFKRSRTSESSQSNAIQCPPMNSRLVSSNPPINKGTSHIFFKTRLCAKFKMGMCRNGENCNFAHGIEDMRQPPPNWQELVGVRDEDRPPSGNWDDDQKIIHKMKLCKKYYNGEECPYGERCNFLHEDPAKFRESSAISIGTNGSPKSHMNGINDSETSKTVSNTGLDVFMVNAKATFWKTKLCIRWDTTGRCPFGEKCHFAHGQAELQASAGRIEAEATGSILVPTKALSASANDSAATYTASLPASNEKEQCRKGLLKWKGLRKIDRIYGDWLDDLPLVNSLPRKVD